jgi:hypothetical protein
MHAKVRRKKERREDWRNPFAPYFSFAPSRENRDCRIRGGWE